MMKEYQTYVFDLYGTLVDILTDETSDSFWRSFALFLQFKGLPCERNELHEKYILFCQKEEQQSAAPDQTEIDLMRVFRKLTEPLCLSKRELSDIALVFRMLSLKRLRLYPGAADVLQKLKRRGKNVVLLTNAQTCFTVPELKILGLYDLFDRIFISSEAGVKKPSPEFFSLLARHGYAPEESVMIGNDPVCDCQGAASAGMDSVYFRTAQSPKGRAKLPKNCMRIKELPQLL